MKKGTVDCANCDKKDLKTWFTSTRDRRPVCEECAVGRYKQSPGYLVDKYRTPSPSIVDI